MDDMIPLSPVISSAAENKHRRERIKTAGVAVLEVFYTRHKRTPNDAEANELLSQVHAVPGCQGFDLERLFAWFRRRRSSNNTTTTTTLKSFYPSLTPETIDHLKVLFQRGIDPNPDVVNTLVQLLKATHEDIMAWIQDNTLYTSPSPEVVRQMPTPGPTTSPEPVRLKSEPAHSPLLLHTSLKSKASESSQIQEIQDPVPPRHVILTIPSKIVVDDHPGVLPRSASDFINLFTPYQDKMEQVLEVIT